MSNGVHDEIRFEQKEGDHWRVYVDGKELPDFLLPPVFIPDLFEDGTAQALKIVIPADRITGIEAWKQRRDLGQIQYWLEMPREYVEDDDEESD